MRYYLIFSCAALFTGPLSAADNLRPCFASFKTFLESQKVKGLRKDFNNKVLRELSIYSSIDEIQRGRQSSFHSPFVQDFQESRGAAGQLPLDPFSEWFLRSVEQHKELARKGILEEKFVIYPALILKNKKNGYTFWTPGIDSPDLWFGPKLVSGQHTVDLVAWSFAIANQRRPMSPGLFWHELAHTHTAKLRPAIMRAEIEMFRRVVDPRDGFYAHELKAKGIEPVKRPKEFYDQIKKHLPSSIPRPGFGPSFTNDPAFLRLVFLNEASDLPDIEKSVAIHRFFADNFSGLNIETNWKEILLRIDRLSPEGSIALAREFQKSLPPLILTMGAGALDGYNFLKHFSRGPYDFVSRIFRAGLQGKLEVINLALARLGGDSIVMMDRDENAMIKFQQNEVSSAEFQKNMEGQIDSLLGVGTENADHHAALKKSVSALVKSFSFALRNQLRGENLYDELGQYNLNHNSLSVRYFRSYLSPENEFFQLIDNR